MAEEDDITGAPRPRISPADWEACKQLWEYGNHSLSDLSERFGLRADTIQARLKKEGVEKGSRAHEAASLIADAENEEMVRQATETTRRIQATKNDHYNWAEAISKLVMQELLDAKKAKSPMGLKNDNLSALNKAAKTLETLRKERYAILGLDTEMGDPDEMDELMVTELTDDQIVSMQSQMRGLGQIKSDLDIEDLTDFDDSIVTEGDE